MDSKDLDGTRESASTTQSSNVEASSRTRQSTMGDSETIKAQDKASITPYSGASETPAKKPNWIVAMIQTQIKTFNIGLLIMATKGALAPIIFLAMYRSGVVANTFGSLGYLIAIICSLCMAMVPRAKFLESIIRHIIFSCIAVATTILGLWAARQARNHTQNPGDTDIYNSNAAAVSAIFLFFNVFAVNAFRARYPKMMMSVVMYAIVSNVGFTLGYLIPEPLPVWYLPKELLVNFLVAFALSLGVNILIIPVTSRTIFFGSYHAYLQAASGLLKAHDTYIGAPHNFHSKEKEEAVMKAKAAYQGTFVKVTADRTDAKKDFAYGVLSTDDISELYKLGRKVSWPLMGLGTVGGIIGEIRRGVATNRNPQEVEKEEAGVNDDDIIKAINVLDRPCHQLNVLCQEGIEHVLCTLQLGKYAKPSAISRLLSKKPATAADDETTDIGKDAFLARFDAGLDAFKGQRTLNLAQFYDDNQANPSESLFLVLYIEFLLFSVAQEIRALILFVDNLRHTGAMTHKVFIYPKMKIIRKGLTRIFSARVAEDVAGEGYGAEEGDIYTKNFNGRVNQTALKPMTNSRTLRRLSTVIASVTKFFKSDEASFGLRVACATFAGTIPAFLRSSYAFYNEYRGVWITITVVLGTGPTTGAGLIGLFTRVLGTIMGGLFAMAVWYIVVGKIPGVIVLSFVVLTLHHYFFMQDPRRIRHILNSFTTFLLIIGYALQPSQIGLAAIEASGQVYLPVYELAPYRMLVTLIGVILAFIFTLFPYPVTSADILRRDIARQFHLFSNVYSLTHARMGIAVMSEGNKESQVLKKLMGKVGFKCIAVQGRCVENLSYTSWEPHIEHRFPKEIYAELLASMQSLFELYIIQNDAISRIKGTWMLGMTKTLGKEFFQTQSHLTLSLLNILSGSLSLDTPLPPFLSTPQGTSFRALVLEKVPEELKLEHVKENGYAVFAALAVSSRLASREVDRCVALVKSLVGEVDLQWAHEGKKEV